MSKRRFIWFLVIIILVIFVIDLSRLGYTALKAYKAGMEGETQLSTGWQAVKQGEWSQAQGALDQAQESFAQARTLSLNLVHHPLWSQIPWYRQQTTSAYNLSKAADIACSTTLKILRQVQEWPDDLSQDLSQLSLSQLSTTSLSMALSKAQQTPALILDSLASLHEIESSLAAVNFGPGLNNLNAPVKEALATLEDGKKLLADYLPWLQLAPYLAKQLSNGRFLLILQNNDELRPTGGFIGNYGLLELQNGHIVNLEVHDSYHLDMPAQDYFKPAPPPLLNKYLGVKQWFLRDANWSPDFPTAARQIGYFYQEQTKIINKTSSTPDIDGVIAITPPLIEDLLGLVGPITVEGQTYNQQNFVDLLQYRVEMSYDEYGVSSWNRKEVINDVISELKEQLMALPSSRLSAVIKIITDNLQQKNILLFSYDPVIEQWLIKANWAGQARSFSGDYVWIVDANLAAYKTDAVVDKQINYKLYNNGSDWLTELTLTYKHNGGFDWRTTRYQSYTRVYVPLGSKLISQSGFQEAATVSEDLGKSVIGGFIVVEPQETKVIKLVYQLPANLAQQIMSGHYNLLLQKQPGRQRTSLTVNLNFPQPVKRAYSGEMSLQSQGNQVNGTSTWSLDTQISVDW